MVVEWMTEWVSECRSALGADSNDLHRHGMNLASAKDALWCLPFVWQGADVFHLSHVDENSKDQDWKERSERGVKDDEANCNLPPILTHTPPAPHLVEEGESMKTFAKESKHFWSVISSFTIPNNICFNQQVLKTAHLQQNEAMRIIQIIEGQNKNKIFSVGEKGIWVLVMHIYLYIPRLNR